MLNDIVRIIVLLFLGFTPGLIIGAMYHDYIYNEKIK